MLTIKSSVFLSSSDVLEVNRPPHLHNKLEDNTATYSGSADMSAIDEFISKNM